jgi:hypothetical protein
MAKLTNSAFEHSPLAADLSIQAMQADGWARFTLSLTTDAAHSSVAASCKEQISSSDIERLTSRLRAAASGASESFEFAPSEPSFTLRCKRLRTGEIETLWIVDHGMATSKYSTDTGVGVMMIVPANALTEFANAIEKEATPA